MYLGERIMQACKHRGLSLSRACAAAELNYSTLHSQINKNREIPFSTIDRLGASLGLPIGYFSASKPSLHVEPSEAATAIQAEAARALSDLMRKQVAAMADWGYRIGTDDVLDWLLAENSQLVNYDWLADRIDLFYPAMPGDNMVRPYKIGAQSLSAKYFRLHDTEDFVQTVGKFDRAILDDLVNAHTAAADQTYVISDRALDQVVDGVRVRGTYRRLMAPVTDLDGQKLMLVFSKLTQFSGG